MLPGWCILMQMGETRVAVLGASGMPGASSCDCSRRTRGRGHVPGREGLGGAALAEDPSPPGVAAIGLRRLRPIDAGRGRRGRRPRVLGAPERRRAPRCVPALLEPGSASMDLAGDFRLHAEAVPRVVRVRASRARAARRRRSTACRSCSATASRARSSWRTRAATRRRSILGMAPLLAAGLVEAGRDPRGREDRAVGRGQGGDRGVHDLQLDRGERASLPRAGAPAHARDGARAASSRPGSRRRCCSCRTWCPAVRGVLTTSVRDAGPRRRRPRPSPRCSSAAYAGRPFVRVLVRRGDGRLEARRGARTSSSCRRSPTRGPARPW